MQQIEIAMLESLSELNGELSKKLKKAYEEARERIFGEIVQGIIRAESNITDHGEPHIKDVLNKSWSVLGSNFEKLSPMDGYILCTSILFHDVGNYFGRQFHNENINKIYNYVRTKDVNNFPDDWADEYSVVTAIVKAHSGKNASGDCDTLRDVGPYDYCHGTKVKLRDIAAIVRFSDELAQGRIRTSTFRLQTDTELPHESEIHHRYEQSVKLTIDKGNGRIILRYTVKISEKAGKLIVSDTDIPFSEFYGFILYRLNKLNAERRYGAYYNRHIEPFKNLQCNFQFIHNGAPLNTKFEHIELTDLVQPDGTHLSRLEQVYDAYTVDRMTSTILEHITGA